MVGVMVDVVEVVVGEFVGAGVVEMAAAEVARGGGGNCVTIARHSSGGMVPWD